LNAGLAVFITEWGTCEASGDGRTDFNSAQTWQDWAATHGISSCNWSIVDKSESCAALSPGAGTSGWNPDSNLSGSGRWVRDFLRGGGPDPGPTPTPTGNGCCAWAPFTECGETDDFCRSRANCENSCQGSWYCCSWGPSYNECGDTTDYCKASSSNCGTCGGHWIRAP